MSGFMTPTLKSGSVVPPKVTVDAAVRVDTELKWSPNRALQKVTFRIFKRRTDEAAWSTHTITDSSAMKFKAGKIILSPAGETSRNSTPSELTLTVPMRGDDWMFGVAACAGEWCSPVSSAVPGGAFEPVGKE
jgi:hypothetical protein